MIAKLKGLLDSVEATFFIIDVHGVGYRVAASGRTLARLPAPGEALHIHTEMLVREDAMDLYGFLSADDRALFRVLLSVQGVGARVALALQTALSSDEIARAVQTQDKAALTQADGVGPKLAARLVTELRDRLGSLSLPPLSSQSGTNSSPVTGIWEDAMIALSQLGYRRQEVQGAFDAIKQKTTVTSVEELIKLTLQHFTRG